MKRLWFALPVLFAIGLGLLFSRGLELDPQAMPTALVDQPLPAVSVRVLGSDTMASPADIQGPALINVWATWCISCVVEHPYLNELSKTVAIYGLNYKDADDKALQWLQEKGDPYRMNFADTDGQLGLEFGVTGAPETYLVDGAGRIVLRHQGVMDAAVWERKFAAYF